jgi:hypothetical protein
MIELTANNKRPLFFVMKFTIFDSLNKDAFAFTIGHGWSRV